MVATTDDGFVTFYRGYARTGVHAVTTAVLTAFGTLTIVHPVFALVALGAYVIPPVALYLHGSRTDDDALVAPHDGTHRDESTTRPEGPRDEPPARVDAPRPETAARTDGRSAGSATRAGGPRDERPPSDPSTLDGGPTADTTTQGDTSPVADGSATGQSMGESTSEQSVVDPGTDRSTTESPPPQPTPEPATEQPTPEPATDQSMDDPDTVQSTGSAAAGRAEPVIAWSAARAPTDDTLADVAVTRDTAVAVGEGGTVLERGEGREPWTVALPDGPGAEGATLHGVDATTDGGAVWVAGDGGSVGRRDAAGRWVDHSAPADDTNNLVDVAVAGSAGAETVLLVDGGGSVRRGRYRDGAVAWDEPTTPGSGSSIAGVVLAGETGYVIDTAGDVFSTTDGGASFTGLELQPLGTPTALAMVGAGVAVSTTGGVVHLHDGTHWTPERVADGELSGLAFDGVDRTVAVGGKSLHSRLGPNSWDNVVVPATAPLRSVAVGDAGCVAVGTAGTIVEQWEDGSSR